MLKELFEMFKPVVISCEVKTTLGKDLYDRIKKFPGMGIVKTSEEDMEYKMTVKYLLDENRIEFYDIETPVDNPDLTIEYPEDLRIRRAIDRAIDIMSVY